MIAGLRESLVHGDERFDTLVLGLGKTGLSCIRYLVDKEENVAVADSREAPPEWQNLEEQYPTVPVFIGEFDKTLLCRAKRLVISPGISQAHPAIQTALDEQVEVTGDIEIFCQDVDAPLIAVTGSNGKSTVVSLLADMIRRSGKRVGLGGNIGTPALDLLRQSTPDYYLLELSSFQLETLSSHRPVVSTVLNVSADHMDRYENLRDYAQTKETIYAGDGTMVINLDDALVRRMLKADRKVMTYSLVQPDADFTIRDHDGESWLVNRQSRLIRQSELRVHGLHNLANILACLALGWAVRLPVDAMVEALRGFTGLPHRCEWVAELDGIRWFNDSKATNVGATLAALDGLSENRKNIHLIAGGEGKDADFSALGKRMGTSVKSAILIGRSANGIAEVVTDKKAIFYATTMQAAVSTAKKLAVPGDIVLLSPACASFDMFQDYEDRGNTFKRCVHEASTGVEK